jgi:hypothetical protein
VLVCVGVSAVGGVVPDVDSIGEAVVFGVGVELVEVAFWVEFVVEGTGVPLAELVVGVVALSEVVAFGVSGCAISNLAANS